MKPLVNIVILNFMTFDLTIKCVEILQKQEYDNFQIIIVDNASTNNSSSMLYTYCSDKNIIFLASKKNEGYASGNNIGLRRALDNNAKYVFIMNNDVQFPEKNYIEDLVSYFELNPEVGLMGPTIYTNGVKELILMENRPNCFNEIFKNFIRIPLWLIGKYKIKNNNKSDRLINTSIQYTKIKKSYTVSGCCLLFRGKCLEEINGFDEGTFLYNEELIIGEKCFNKGILVVHNSNFYVFHEHGSTINKFIHAKQQSCYEERSRLYYYKKFRKDVHRIGYFLLYLSSKFNRYVNIPIIYYFEKRSKCK